MAAAIAAFAEARQDESDGNSVLSKRHVIRMEHALLKTVTDLCKATNVDGLKLLLDSKLHEHLEPKDIWAQFWVYYPPAGTEFSTFDMFIEYDAMAAALDNERLLELIYTRNAKEWCGRLLQPRFTDSDQIFVSAKHIKWAEHRMARTNGGKNPEKMALLKFLQDHMKERSKRRAAQRKAERDAEEEEEGPAEPEPAPSKRSTRSKGSAPAEEEAEQEAPKSKKAKTAAKAPDSDSEWECKLLSKMAGRDEMWLMSAPKWDADRAAGIPSAWPELWTCGLFDPRHPPDHATHNGPMCKAGYEACMALEKQLATWKPEHFNDQWQAFIIRPETLAANGVSTDDVCTAACTVIGAACHAPGADPARGLSSEMQTLALSDSRSTFFNQRFYYTFRVNTKELAKVKSATNHIKKMTEKGSCFFIQFAHKDSCTVAPRCLIVGKTKPQYSDGGVLVVSFVDRDQEHYHHGSIRST